MPTEATLPESKLQIGEIPVFDPESNFHAVLSTGWGPLGEGSYKTVEGHVWYLTLPTGQKVNLGSVGTPVSIRSKPRQNLFDLLHTIKHFENETSWLETFQNNLLYDEDMPTREGIFRIRQTGRPYNIEQESTPFAHSLGDALEILRITPSNILAPEGTLSQSPAFADHIRQFLLLSHLAKATRALEHFHKMRLAVGWNKEIHVTHGDAGQWHLNNYLTSAKEDISTHDIYRLIDMSFVQEVNQPNQIQEEVQAFTRQVMNYFATDHQVMLLHPELFHYLQKGNLLDAKTLALFASNKLREVAHEIGKSLPETLATIEHRYFLSYLYDKVEQQTHHRLPLSALESINLAINQTYPDQPTQSLQTIK